jgi:hypothetical protein
MSNLSSLVAVVEDELEMPSLSMLKWANVIHAARQVAPLAKAFATYAESKP